MFSHRPHCAFFLIVWILFFLVLSATLVAAGGTPPVSFQAPRTFAVGRVPQSIALGDFNNDGRKDLAVANIFADNLSILLSEGDGTFRPAVNYSTGASPNCIVVGDFNGDGNLDLAVANRDSNNVSILLWISYNFSNEHRFRAITGWFETTV